MAAETTPSRPRLKLRSDAPPRHSSETVDADGATVPTIVPPSAWAVMSQLDDLLHRENDLPRLNEIYRAVFSAMPKPNPSYHMRTTPYWRMASS